MSSHATYLTINNKTSRDMTITVSEINDHDWDGSGRPDNNFNNVTLRAGQSLRQREEINTGNSTSARFRMTMAFPGGPYITFQLDQWDARLDNFQRDYTQGASPDQSAFRCFQRAGGDENQFDIVERSTCLSVMSWNVDKDGTQGDGSQEGGLDPILNAFGTTISVPDVLLLQETDVQKMYRYGQKLGEFAGDTWVYYGENEDGRDAGNANAIVSRYPFQSMGVLKFQSQCAWGGRNAVWAEIGVPGWGRIRLYSAHLESGSPTDWALGTRTDQWNELVKHADCGTESIIGGDFNGSQDFGSGGYLDCHLNQQGDRSTCKALLGWKTYDFLLARSKYVQAGNVYPNIGNKCGMISDHYPIVASKFF